MASSTTWARTRAFSPRIPRSQRRSTPPRSSLRKSSRPSSFRNQLTLQAATAASTTKNYRYYYSSRTAASSAALNPASSNSRNSTQLTSSTSQSIATLVLSSISPLRAFIASATAILTPKASPLPMTQLQPVNQQKRRRSSTTGRTITWTLKTVFLTVLIILKKSN